jgi:hypothetical protein
MQPPCQKDLQPWCREAIRLRIQVTHCPRAAPQAAEAAAGSPRIAAAWLGSGPLARASVGPTSLLDGKGPGAQLR